MLNELLEKYYVINKNHILKGHKCEICENEVKRGFRKPNEVRNAFIVVIKKNHYAMRLCKYHFNRYLKQKKEKIEIAFNNFITIKP